MLMEIWRRGQTLQAHVALGELVTPLQADFVEPDCAGGLGITFYVPTPGQINSEFGLLFPQNLLSCQTNLTDGFLAPSPFFSTTFF